MKNKYTQTPSQTVGPYFSYGLTPQQGGYGHKSIASPILTTEDTPGEHINISGKLYDGAGDIIPDTMIEIWQADANGRYLDVPPGDDIFTGFGRCDCEEKHEFYFKTVKPGRVADGHAPHINVIIFMRGMLSHAYTRIYFADEMDANNQDAVFLSVPEDRRHTILAKRQDDSSYHINFHMQGENETVFFDV